MKSYLRMENSLTLFEQTTKCRYFDAIRKRHERIRIETLDDGKSILFGKSHLFWPEWETVGMQSQDMEHVNALM